MQFIALRYLFTLPHRRSLIIVLKILLLSLLPVGVTAQEPPPSLVFLEYLGLSQELAEIGIDIDAVEDNNTPESTVDPEATDQSESNSKSMEKS